MKNLVLASRLVAAVKAWYDDGHTKTELGDKLNLVANTYMALYAAGGITELIVSKEDAERLTSQDTLELAAKPLVDWLRSNGHPHHTIIVTQASAELVEGQMVARYD